MSGFIWDESSISCGENLLGRGGRGGDGCFCEEGDRDGDLEDAGSFRFSFEAESEDAGDGVWTSGFAGSFVTAGEREDDEDSGEDDFGRMDAIVLDGVGVGICRCL